MSKKSRQRKVHGQRPSQAPTEKTVPLAPAIHKPWQIAAVCLVLAVVTVFAFRGVRSNDYIEMDDVGCVMVNQEVQHGFSLHSMEWAFTTYHCANWHPLTWISHIADWSFYGKSPGGHHLTNVYLHAANSVLLFLLLLYMTGFLGRSAMVAILFALHPAHVESVAWLSERKDVLCVFFWFATMLAYAWYVRRPSWKRFMWVVCGFACALMSKPMAVTLPFTLLLLDVWPLGRITFTKETRARWFASVWKLCIEKWPLFIMAVIASVITILAQRASGAVASLQLFPWWERICNAAISYWRYAWIMVWPDPLLAFYYYDLNHVMVSAAVISILALVMVTAACWRMRWKMPYCLIGWLWFLGTLVPVIGIVQVGNQALAERYTYLPFIGLFIAVVWLVADAVANSPKIRIATQLVAVAVIAACVLKTEAQVKVWKDNVTLFTHVLAVDSRGSFPNSILGVAYVRLGRFAEAQDYLERALTYNPDDPLDLSYSAYCMMQTAMLTHDQRNLPLAGERLEKALRLHPDYPLALTYMAQWSFMMGKTTDEETYSRMAVAGDPDSLMAWIYLGDALQAQGKLDEAAQDWRHVLDLDPKNCDAHNSLGAIFDKQGLKQEALKEFRLSLTLKPDQSVAHSKIGRILMENHQLPEAVEEFTLAVRYDPRNANAHNALGAALFQQGDYEKAAEQFGDAVYLDPASSRQNLEIAQARMKIGKVEQAKK